jgi:hypothetical protein
MRDFWDATYFELCCAYDGLCRWHGTGPFAKKKSGGPWTSADVARARAAAERSKRNRDRLPKPAIPDHWLKKLRRVNARLKARRAAKDG